jgi:nicotinamidase-related amidase
MQAYFYGQARELPDEFDEYFRIDRTAVVCIDMHRGHLDTDDPSCPCPAPRAREIVEPIDAFHRACRALGIPIVHVRTGLRKSGVDDTKSAHPAAWRKTFPMTVGPIPGADRHGITGTRWTEFVTEVLDEDHTVDSKKRLSPFYVTDLEFLLRNLRREVIVLDGGFTDCCVLNAAFDGSNRGFRVIVPQDLVQGFSPEMEDAALKIVSLHLGLVVDSAALLQEWHRRAEGAGGATALAAGSRPEPAATLAH